MNGYDSARTSLISCTEPHLFEVTGILEWPKMDAVLTGADPGKVWDTIHQSNGSGDGEEYISWASEACQGAAQELLLIDRIEIDGHDAGALRLSVGGGYGIDLSLGSRDEFVAGDHRTVCSVAWYGGGPRPRKVTTPEGLDFSDYAGPGFDLEQRECWDVEAYAVSCAEPHAVQSLVGFDGLEAYGEEIVAHMAEGKMSEEDYKVADAFCEKLLFETIPDSDGLDDLGFLAEASASPAWDDYKGTVDPDGGYFFACLAGPLEAGALMNGDVFAGNTTIEPGTGSDSEA
jgi:hypothetical protein